MESTRTFELGVYDQSDDFTVRLVDLLEGDDPCDWYGDDSSVLIVHDGDRELLREEWNFGALSRVVEQLAAGHERLAAGRPAILRSAVTDEPSVPWVLFEPGEHGTAISVFFLSSGPLLRQFPDRPGADALYQHVFDTHGGPERHLKARVPTAALVRDIESALTESRAFLARCGRTGES